MSELYMSIARDVNNENLNNVIKRIRSLKQGDQINIRLESADAQQVNKIVKELENNGFDYQPHGGNTNDYYLRAKKTN